MSGRGTHQALAKRHHRQLIERELRELGEECTNVVRLLQRLDEYRAAQRDAGGSWRTSVWP